MYKTEGKAGKEARVIPELQLGKYYRYLWEDPQLMVIIGYFPKVLVSKKLYEQQHGIKPPSDATKPVLHRFMGACALAAVSLADRESWGWTVTLPGSDVGFFCGMEPEGIITARVRPAPSARRALYVQRQKGKQPMTQSLLEPELSDPAAAVTLYFEQTAQLETRIALDDECSGVLVQPLPGGRFDEVKKLPDDKLLELCRQTAGRGELSPMGEVLVFYECRCDDQMILDMLTALPETERAALWGDLPSITVECPRCGREYTIQRTHT